MLLRWHQKNNDRKKKRMFFGWSNKQDPFYIMIRTKYLFFLIFQVVALPFLANWNRPLWIHKEVSLCSDQRRNFFQRNIFFWVVHWRIELMWLYTNYIFQVVIVLRLQWTLDNTIGFLKKFFFYRSFQTLYSKKRKVGDLSRKTPAGSLFNSYYTEV